MADVVLATVEKQAPTNVDREAEPLPAKGRGLTCCTTVGDSSRDNLKNDCKSQQREDA